MPPNDTLKKTDEPEDQDKKFDASFGVFFDVHQMDGWINTVGNARKDAEQWKNDMENDVRDNEYFKYGQLAVGIAEQIVDTLGPDNPVSKAIQTGLEYKDQILGYKDWAEDKYNELTGAIDDKSNAVLDQEIIQISGMDPLGSKHSIISLMEPVYQGVLQELSGNDVFGTYCFRILVQGGIVTDDFKESEEELCKDMKPQWSDKAVEDAYNEIERNLKTLGALKLSVHIDMFGYEKDASMGKLEPKLNGLQQSFPNIEEFNIDYKGKYKNLNDPDEVKGDLGGTQQRFRETKFLEKS